MPDDLPPNPDDSDPPPDDPDLVAYLDGELDADEARLVESKLALDPAARAKAEALKKTYDLLDYLPRPEPSADFTRRTLTRIELPATGRSSSAVPSPGTGYAPRPSGRTRFRVAAWVAAGLLASAAGYLVHAVFPVAPPKDSNGLAFSDVRVIENLPLYLGADDLDFVRRLDESELFLDEPADADFTGKPGTAIEPVTPAQRDALTKLFRSFPPARQQQLRQLDQQLHDLDAAARDRLTGTLENYAVWLDRLPDPERKEVLAAPSPAERIDAVRRVKSRSWRAVLPASYRARLEAVASTEERDRLIAEYRKQDADRRAAWDLARRQWDAFKNQKKPWPFADEVVGEQVEQYARYVLRPRLAGGEAVAFDRVRQELFQDPSQDGKGMKWFQYGMTLLELADRHPTLPEYDSRKPVVREADLPKDFVRDLQVAARKAGGTRKVLQNLPTGRWPEFAEAVAREAKELGVPIDFPIGPSKPGEFTPAVNEFVTKTLKNKLRGDEWQSLRKLEGRWPDYPRKLLALARDRDLSVPGVTLPGPPSQWARYYRPQRGRK
jgi:hypothetical protein